MRRPGTVSLRARCIRTIYHLDLTYESFNLINITLAQKSHRRVEAEINKKFKKFGIQLTTIADSHNHTMLPQGRCRLSQGKFQRKRLVQLTSAQSRWPRCISETWSSGRWRKVCSTSNSQESP